MNKEKVYNIVNVMPNGLKVFKDFIKDSFDKNGQETLDEANGIAGVFIKLFGRDYINKYFDKKKKEKLSDYGIKIYLQAALIQSIESLKVINNDSIKINSIDSLRDIFDENLLKIDLDNTILLFEPKYHPIIKLVKNICKGIIFDSNLKIDDYNAFLKHFNTNISSTVESTFGEDDYKEHKEEIRKFLLNERESDYLNDIHLLSKIGFKDDENLKYEKSYGKWEKFNNLFSSTNSEIKDDKVDLSMFDKISENNLKLVEELIEEYYNSREKIVLREILFIIADFGKGKSIFLKQYAAKLAKEYVNTSEGYFPIYFNLRNYSNYQSNVSGGVLADYLKKDYGIDIFNEYYKNKKYIFLVDSLDESGELNKHSIEDVIRSIIDIQNLDTTSCRDNRIIITSRPFEDGLESQIRNHLPYTDENNKLYFLSLYGFTETQFNDWIYDSIKNHMKNKDIVTNSFSEQFVESIKKGDFVDIYNLLIENRTLTAEELKRPIFAYMIFQLIINNIDFSKIGKVGVYLSFLNLLTKEAKHIDDLDCNYNLQDEIESRNILHSIAALWMYGRLAGKQGTLKKADIFRVLAAEKISEDDNKVLDENLKNKVNDIKFLSHSYFGAKDDLLHFQHQSFAEILLAEYYLKIFIKYSFDEDTDIEEARVLLNLGEPTEQTIIFFKELLQLLKDSASPSEKEKRKLLFPLFASLSTEKHNKHMRCNSLYYEWLKKVKLNEHNTYPNELINEWCIDDEKLNKICDLSKQIIESRKTYLTTKSTFHKALYDNEVIKIDSEELYRVPHNIDKWLSLLVGNIIYNDENSKSFFNSSISHPEIFFDMMKDWNYSFDTAVPNWANDYFKGLNMKNIKKVISLKGVEVNGVNFSYSSLKLLSLKYGAIANCNFDNCSFEDIDFFNIMYNCTFFNIVDLKNSVIRGPYDNMPINLMCNFFSNSTRIGVVKKPFISDTYYIYSQDGLSDSHEIDELDFLRDFELMKGFFIYGLDNDYFTKGEIIDSFDYQSESVKSRYIELVNSIQNK